MSDFSTSPSYKEWPWFWKLMLLPWFGHGRMSEFQLASYCFIIGMILLWFPQQAWSSPAFVDLAWEFDSRYLSTPFLLKALLSGSGLAFNVWGYTFSKYLRFSGAFVGVFLWSWLATKLGSEGSLLIGWAITLPNAYISIRIMAFSLANLPIPGIPGRI